MVTPQNLKGRPFDYRDEIALVFDEELIVRACDSCGELYLKGAASHRFGSVLERLRLARKREAAEQFLDTAQRELPGVSRALWEKTLGLSKGYLSRLVAGTRVADTPLEIILKAFAREPTAILRALQDIGHLPSHLASRLQTRGPVRSPEKVSIPAVPAEVKISSTQGAPQARVSAAPKELLGASRKELLLRSSPPWRAAKSMSATGPTGPTELGLALA